MGEGESGNPSLTGALATTMADQPDPEFPAFWENGSLGCSLNFAHPLGGRENLFAASSMTNKIQDKEGILIDMRFSNL